jgi:hypothetical protein
MNITAHLPSVLRLEFDPLLYLTHRLSRLMRFEEGMNLPHRQGNSVLGFFPRKDAHFGLGREQRALHGDGVGVRGDIARQHQDWIMAITHEIACHGEDEAGVGFEHIGHKLVGRLYRDLGPVLIALPLVESHRIVNRRAGCTEGECPTSTEAPDVSTPQTSSIRG